MRGLKLDLLLTVAKLCESHPTRSAWIEIFLRFGFSPSPYRRTPPGVRGLKYCPRGFCTLRQACRTPPGVRGLKFTVGLFRVGNNDGRTPPGVRGLKFKIAGIGEEGALSHPTRGAWIEIAHSHRGLYFYQSHLTWCARIEILTLSLCNSKPDVTRFVGVRINVMWKPSLWIWRNTFVPCSLHRCLASLTIWVRQALTAAAFQLKKRASQVQKATFLVPNTLASGIHGFYTA